VRWLIAAFVGILTLAPLSLQAADLPLPAPGPAVYAPPPAYRAVTNWSGFYVGDNVGVGLARDKSTFSFGGAPFATTDTAVFGAVGGAQVGYNWQSGALVLGAEDDFDWSNLKGSISAQCGICGPVTNASLEHDVDWFGRHAPGSVTLPTAGLLMPPADTPSGVSRSRAPQPAAA